MPAEPVTPRPAATIILLRRGGRHASRGLEVLMVRRSTEARFMPGVWVFPGGAVHGEEAVSGRSGWDEASLDPEELAHRACAVRELCEEAGIELADDAELLPWSRWITPEGGPIRFDTRFYVALAPAHAPPRADGAETTDAGWFSPQAALERHRAGEMSLVFPTIRHLEELLPYSSSEEVLEAAQDRVVRPVLPRLVGDEVELRVVMPGEPGY